MTAGPREHRITIEAVHIPDSEHPYAAQCSCGLRWQVPEWGAIVGKAVMGDEPTEPTMTVAEAVERAKGTFQLWSALHPTVPPPNTRKPRPEVVQALAARLMGELDEALLDLEELVVAYEATTGERNRALDRAIGLDPT